MPRVTPARIPTGGGQGNQRKKIIEEYARLDAEYAQLKPRLLRYSHLRELILDWHKDLPGDEEITLEGETVSLTLSARDKLRTVTDTGKLKLLELWGPQNFARKAHIQLRMLPDPEDKDHLYTEKAATGPRHLYVTRLKAGEKIR